jgi:ADP-heptose:LPS heptosyltransferase
MQTKLILQHHRSPGDVLMLTAALRDLHLAHPKKYLTDVLTNCSDLFKYNPNVTKLSNDPSLKVLKLDYSSYTYTADKLPFHFITAFHQELKKLLNIEIPVTAFKPDLHFSEDELKQPSYIHELVGRKVPYWIVNAGCKSDITCKLWPAARFQEVVNKLNNIYFVQVGSDKHMHPTLIGENVINLVGKTSYRDFMLLMRYAYGVLTGVSFAMHLSAGVPIAPIYNRKERACVVLAGGREPVQWEAYPYHTYIHTRGILPCSYGWCQGKRIEKLNDGTAYDNKLCKQPVVSDGEQKVAGCMDLITVEEVVNHIWRLSKCM